MWWFAFLACTPPPSGTPTGDSAAAPTAVPTADLESWLASGAYLDWPAEAEPHESTGPHFGAVRTFLSPALAASLEGGASRHPEGSASVKELYGDGAEVLGYAVMVRINERSNDDAWYWFESFDGRTFADRRGAGVCVGCHDDGTDYVLTPWPQ